MAAGSSLLACTASSLPQVQRLITIAAPPEVRGVRLGIIPSLEVAPLLVAQAKQLFAKYGLTEVELIPLRSWRSICYRTVLGSQRRFNRNPTQNSNPSSGRNFSQNTDNRGIDGGQFYSPLPELINEGIIYRSSHKTAMYVLMRLHTHGGYIVASNRLKPWGINLNRASFASLQDLAKLLGNPMNCAITERGSNHDLWLRYWLTTKQTIPNRDIDIVQIARDRLINFVKQNQADLLCIDSWQTLQLINENLAYPAIAISDIWRNYPGEVLAMRADWVDQNPIATQALMQAIMEAQIWCDNPDNAQELNTNLNLALFNRNLDANPLPMFSQFFQNSRKRQAEVLQIDTNASERANQNSSLIHYWSNDGVSVSYPYKSHDLWFLTEYRRWGMLPPSFEVKETIDAVNREDLWKNAAKAIGVPDTSIPINTSRGIETFFDGQIFDPVQVEQYLEQGNRIKM